MGSTFLGSSEERVEIHFSSNAAEPAHRGEKSSKRGALDITRGGEGQLQSRRQSRNQKSTERLIWVGPVFWGMWVMGGDG